tara:strand:- start:1664 stop:2239 length:576 start_codon:yes stop_codon:yes gene_type:complete
MSVDEALLNYSEKYYLLNVPGIGDSGLTHWQTNWEMSFPEIKRVIQDDWEHQNCNDWVKTLEIVIRNNQDRPIILISHSLGGGAVIHANALDKLQHVKGVFIVALPDIEREDFPEDCSGFIPMPKKVLSIPGVMISSETDEWCEINVAEEWAEILNVPLINIGNKQHICGASEFETWEEGKRLLVEFLDSL